MDGIGQAVGAPLDLAAEADLAHIRHLQKELAAGADRFRQLADSLPNSSVIMFDRDLRVSLAAGEALTARGYAPDVMDGALLSDLFSPEMIDQVETPFRAALAGRSSDLEYVSATTGRQYRIRVRPVHDSGGLVIGGLSVSGDISEGRARQAQLEQIHRLSHLGSCWYDRRGHWIFDHELLELWGLESATDVAALLPESVLPEDRVAVLDAWNHVRSQGGQSTVSYRIRHGRTGQIRHIQSTQQLVVDSAGNLLSGTATHVDVTEAVAAVESAAAAKAAAARLRGTMLRRLSDALVTTGGGPDEFLRRIADLAAVMLVSGVVLRILTPDQGAIERDLIAHPDPDARLRLTAAMAKSKQSFEPGPIRDQVIRAGRVVSTIGVRVTPAEHRRFADQTGWASAHSIAAPIRHDGQVVGLFIVVRTDPNAPYESGDDDLVQELADRAGSAVAEYRVLAAVDRERDRRKQELTERQRQLLDDLAGLESSERYQLAETIHDEPIQLIVAAVLRLDALGVHLSAQQRGEMDRVASLLELSVDQLRDIIVVSLSPPDLSGGIRAALRDLAHQVFLGSVTVVISGPSHVQLSPTVKAAAYRILREALLNVRKHAHAHGVTLAIEERDQQVVFSLTDDGVGGVEVGAAEASGNRGVLVMRARAEIEGGRLDIDSPAGRGTKIVLSLPVTGTTSRARDRPLVAG